MLGNYKILYSVKPIIMTKSKRRVSSITSIMLVQSDVNVFQSQKLMK